MISQQAGNEIKMTQTCAYENFNNNISLVMINKEDDNIEEQITRR